MDYDWMMTIEERKAPRMDVTVKCPRCGLKWVMPVTPVAIKCSRCFAVLLMELQQLHGGGFGVVVKQQDGYAAGTDVQAKS